MRVLYFLFVLFSIASCGSQEEMDTDQMLTYDQKGDTLKNDFAATFRIIAFDNYKQIDVLDPESGRTIYRYGYGDNVPKNKIDLGSKVEKIAALSATHVGMLKKLQLENRIMGVSSTKYLCGDENDSGWINYGDLGNSDPELFIEHRPSLIMYSGFRLDHPILEKIDKIGIPTFVNYDWKEIHPLGRVEWLKVFGVLFECEEYAQMKYDEIKKNYLQLVKRIQNDTTSPSVLVGTLYGDVFNVPAGDSYMAKMLKDANVNYTYEDSEGTGSLNISLEEVITANRNTDYLLNIAASSKKEVLNMNQNFELLAAFKKGSMYSYFGNVNCFWERSAVEPDKVLFDLIHILHNDQFEDETLNFYEQLR